MSVTQFQWLSQSVCPPARWDLRYLGWQMLDDSDELPDPDTARQRARAIDSASCPVLLDWRAQSRPEDWRDLSDRRWTIVIGVEDADDRAALLAFGYGEVLPTNVAMVELAARALRIGEHASAMQRFRKAGPVILDLFHRDGRIERQWLGFHPREFALLWRLAETPGKRVTRRELLSDVWRLDHDPETNSVEVHISRLRAKLAISKACWLILTDPRGGYRLAADGGSSFFAYGSAREQALDRLRGIGNDALELASGETDAIAAERTGVDRSR